MISALNWLSNFRSLVQARTKLVSPETLHHRAHLPAELYVRQCGEMLKLTEAMRQLLVQQLESGFAEPLRIRLEADASKEAAMKVRCSHHSSVR